MSRPSVQPDVLHNPLIFSDDHGHSQKMPSGFGEKKIHPNLWSPVFDGCSEARREVCVDANRDAELMR